MKTVSALGMTVTIMAALALGSQAPRLLREWRGNARSGDFRVHLAGQPARLTLYGTSTCPHCAEARAWLSASGIAFNDRVINTTPEAAAMYEQLGENSVPVLVAQDRLIVGFNAADYAALAKASPSKEKK
ncbi:MAG TPA: glutaredoxin family protein [Telluria sp.]|jgi:glutaredoxin|nr:glutaredoxin family protein [Telluria sp.]